MLSQSIINIRRDAYVKDLTAFVSEFVPQEMQFDATMELTRILRDHFELTLDQYELDSGKEPLA